MPDWNHIVRERLAVLRLPPEREIEIVDEFALHMESVYEGALADGLSPAEAEARALRGYDWRLLEYELSRAEQPPAAWALQPSLELIERKGGIRMGPLIQDLRYGARMLAKNPGFTLIAVLTLALGIGANTAIFSVVNAVMLRPLPYPQPERLVMVGPTTGGELDTTGEPQFLFIHEQQQSFAALMLYQPVFSGINLAGGNEPEYVEGAKVSFDFFRVVGFEPAIGRGFTPQEDRPGGEPVAVISADLWRRRFGGDASVIGRPALINGRHHTVIGVMPQGFTGFEFLSGADIFVPLRPSMQGDPNPNYMMVGRLKDGVSLKQARADLQLVAEKYRAIKQREMDPRESVTAQPIQEYLAKDVRGLLWILMTTVGFVLLIACANVANLQLTRAVDRRKEVAVRLALGAGLRRVVMMLVTEGMLLALIGGLVGALLAWWSNDYLTAFVPEQAIPLVGKITLDWRVLAFALAAAALTGVVFGLAPAGQVLKLDLNQTLKEGAGKGAGGAARGRLRNALVVTEIALSLVLLIGAALLVRTFVNLHRVEPGFDPRHVLTFQATPMGPQYATAEQNREFYRRALERLNAAPGVEAAAMTSTLPLSSQFRIRMEVVGRPTIPESVQFRVISPNYFKVMKTPVRQGRVFTENDAPNSEPVAVVNDAFIRRYLSDADPLAQPLIAGQRASGESPRRIVGVVGDTKQFGLGSEASPMVFIPITQTPDRTWRMLQRFVSTKFVVRASDEPLALANAVRQTMVGVDATLPVTKLLSMEQVVEGSVAAERFNMTLVGLFAALGLLLAGVGVYGVMSYAVSQRTREIGIRVALGAQTRDVLGIIIGQGMTLTLTGLVIGVGAAFGLTRLMKTLLFGVKATDPVTFIAVALLLVGVALLACYIPARRAAKVDPLVALRAE
jgi:putative ABC transport system permease protein